MTLLKMAFFCYLLSMNTIEKLQEYGTAVFGSKDKYSIWLEMFCPALGIIPKELLETEAGRDQIRDELGRIEHGIFA
jgi:uncharacterized protein (DUF2384 family)